MSSPDQAAKEHLIGAKAMLSKFPALYSLLRDGRDAWRRFYPTESERLYLERPRRINAMEQEIQRMESLQGRRDEPPVLFFNITSGPRIVSFNSISSLVISWALRLAGHNVAHLRCRRSVPRCVQGTNWMDLDELPPCEQCLERKSELFPSRLSWHLDGAAELAGGIPALDEYSLENLTEFVYKGIELGTLCLPSVRFALRRHDLSTTPVSLRLVRDYLQGGMRLVDGFERLLENRPVRSVVLFNGSVFPEAVVRAVALRRGLPVFSYEVGYRPHSLFLTNGIATAYPVQIPEDFHMEPAREAELDRHLAQRLQGNFTMGGARFWPEMKSLTPEITKKADSHRQVVVVFTNVVFDTSQIHASTIFENMFDWLEETMKLASAHQETLFVVRAHPDELRHGRESQEPVGQWLKARGYLDLPNITFIPPTEYVSSYDLVHLSQFCIVYNSTIGLEAALIGTPVIMGGHSRYSQAACTHIPAGRAEYLQMVESFIRGGAPPLAKSWQEQARRYMYYTVFRTSLDLSAFVQPINPVDYTLKSIRAIDLHPDSSQEMRIIYDGIINGKTFCYT